MCFVVDVEEVGFGVGTSMSNGVEADVAGDLGSVEVTYDLLAQLGR